MTGLNAVVAISSRDAWAVGNETIDHWNGSKWQSGLPGASVPSGVSWRLAAITAIPATNPVQFLAVGATSCHALIERWDGTRWERMTPASNANKGVDLDGVTAISTSDAWAVGRNDIIEHWNGSTLEASSCARRQSVGKQLRRPGTGPWPLVVGRQCLGGLATSDLNCESDGTDAGPSILIEHWNGRAWKYAENPGYSGGFFDAIVPLSARNIWAVGTAADPNSGDFTGTRIQHWDGTKWSDVTTPPAGLGANLWGAAAVSANAIWAVGWSYTSRLTTRSLVERWNGRKWKVVPSAHISRGRCTLRGCRHPRQRPGAVDVW